MAHGSENENLPGFIVFTDHRGGPINGPPNWGSGFLPAAYQGTQFRDGDTPIVDLKPARPRTRDEQQRWLWFLHEMKERHASENPLDTEPLGQRHRGALRVERLHDRCRSLGVKHFLAEASDDLRQKRAQPTTSPAFTNR